MNYKNKTVVITGGSRGIGAGIALAFAKQKANIAIIYKNNHKKAKEILNTLSKYNNIYKIYCCDISNYNDVITTFNEIKKDFYNIDILINNAGISHWGLVSDLDYSTFDNIISTNLNSAFYCSKQVISDMINKKNGHIINISSIWGTYGASCEVAYSMSKGGINAFTKALSRELGPSNIRVNAIACGFINTSMNNNLSNEEKEQFLAETSLQKEGTPNDVANLCLFLTSDKSNYITGQIIHLDGGL